MGHAARRGHRARHLRDEQVETYFAAATQAALVLAEFRAPYRGRTSPVNAWWGTFDLAAPSSRAGRRIHRRTTSSCGTRPTPSRSRSAGGPAIPKHGEGGLLRLRVSAPDGFASARSTPTPRTGTRAGRVHPRLGRRPRAPTIPTPSPSSSLGRLSACVRRVRLGSRPRGERRERPHPLSSSG